MELAAEKQHGRALKCATEQVKSGREVVLTAVKQDADGCELKHASKELQ